MVTRMSALRLWRHTLRCKPSSAPSSRCRQFSTAQRLQQAQDKPASHAQFYSELVPGMIPIALLGSAVYIGLQLLQSRLSHEKYLEEALARVNALEAQVDGLLAERGARSKDVPNADARAATSPTSGASGPGGWFGRFW
ncbi:hypothetical protein EW146_g8954 [Bondarzewia mesenterica]|uniref:Uncharacterized protein n=1 Tax=Bondarzewia mesenterica TaxID=1095465 RepID=A0A4S4LAC9_9AGAM|nr:hypothetical protein EW146_g8954 [Bondarzewia mesenterica]